MQRWSFPPECPADLPLWEKVLFARGLDSGAKRQEFLSAVPLDPFSFADMHEAVRLIHEVLLAPGRIAVFGDYDADGLTATAIMVRLLRQLGGSVSWMIPDRLDDGYGMADSHVASLISQHPDLVITVDCGSNNRTEVERLKQAGILVIVTDHHVTEEGSRFADAHLNPRNEAAVSDLLSGAGVAYCLAEAYISTHRPEWLSRLSALRVLAMVGTVADLMPLTGANRALVGQALRDFDTCAPPGLACLAAGKADLTASSVAYSIAPALNAASRLGEAATALELLLADSPEQAARLAVRLKSLNDERRTLEAGITAEAFRQAADSDASVIVVRDEAWHAGVLGIVAARLVERLGKPAIVLSRDGDVWQGSARSLPDVDIHGLLSQTAHCLDRFGGHCQAAGLAVSDESYDQFVDELQRLAAVLPRKEAPLTIDVVLSGRDLEKSELQGLHMLEPCGEANTEPLVAALGCRILSVQVIGQGSHSKLEVLFDGVRLTGIMFRRGDLDRFYQPGDVVDLAGHPNWHVFRNTEYPQILLRDVHPAGGEETDISLDTELFGQVYRELAKLGNLPQQGISPALFAKRLGRVYNRRYAAGSVKYALIVLEEAGMLTLAGLDELNLSVRLVTDPVRTALSDTPTWRTLVEKGWLKP